MVGYTCMRTLKNELKLKDLWLAQKSPTLEMVNNPKYVI